MLTLRSLVTGPGEHVENWDDAHAETVMSTIAQSLKSKICAPAIASVGEYDGVWMCVREDEATMCKVVLESGNAHEQIRKTSTPTPIMSDELTAYVEDMFLSVPVEWKQDRVITLRRTIDDDVIVCETMALPPALCEESYAYRVRGFEAVLGSTPDSGSMEKGLHVLVATMDHIFACKWMPLEANATPTWFSRFVNSTAPPEDYPLSYNPPLAKFVQPKLAFPGCHAWFIASRYQNEVTLLGFQNAANWPMYITASDVFFEDPIIDMASGVGLLFVATTTSVFRVLIRADREATTPAEVQPVDVRRLIGHETVTSVGCGRNSVVALGCLSGKIFWLDYECEKVVATYQPAWFELCDKALKLIFLHVARTGKRVFEDRGSSKSRRWLYSQHTTRLEHDKKEIRCAKTTSTAVENNTLLLLAKAGELRAIWHNTCVYSTCCMALKANNTPALALLLQYGGVSDFDVNNLIRYAVTSQLKWMEKSAVALLLEFKANVCYIPIDVRPVIVCAIQHPAFMPSLVRIILQAQQEHSRPLHSPAHPTLAVSSLIRTMQNFEGINYRRSCATLLLDMLNAGLQASATSLVELCAIDTRLVAPEMLHMLLKNGANIREEALLGLTRWSALGLACTEWIQKGTSSLILELVQRGADVNTGGTEQLPLASVVYDVYNIGVYNLPRLQKCWKVVSALIAKGASPTRHVHHGDELPAREGALGCAFKIYDRASDACKPYVLNFIRSMLRKAFDLFGSRRPLCHLLLKSANDHLIPTMDAIGLVYSEWKSKRLNIIMAGWKLSTHLHHEQEVRSAVKTALSVAHRLQQSSGTHKLPSLPIELWLIILGLMDTTPAEWIKAWPNLFSG